jgi:hypothetical protein
MMNLFDQFEVVYANAKCITDEITEVMNYLCTYTKDKLTNEQYSSMIDIFLKIGIEEMLIMNADAQSHLIQG